MDRRSFFGAAALGAGWAWLSAEVPAPPAAMGQFTETARAIQATLEGASGRFNETANGATMAVERFNVFQIQLRRRQPCT